MTEKTRSLAVTVLAVGLLPLLAACGGEGADSASSASGARSGATAGDGADASSGSGGGELAVPAGADQETKQRYLVENAVAACMKKQGFTYTPYVLDESESSKALDGRDYELARQYRQKYGFGLYAGAVYPDDPQAPNSAAEEKKLANPNSAYRDKLTPAQRTAYFKALGQPEALEVGDTVKDTGCMKEANTAVYGPEKSAAELAKEQTAKNEENARAGQRLNGDPELVRLAQSYASCLTGEGLRPETTQPTGIVDTVKFGLSAGMPPEGTDGLAGDALKSLFATEVDAAMKDLKCGREFRAAYFPKLKANPHSEGQG
ncbi:hypothetical protein AB0P17_00365 [Streptomyces sp. NPDC088124]|uniref:hypothetical protein n=1 Tax=Streptomyces sp. NPDC088124 TaxID=3154654 RepID=UPI0034189C29